MNQENKTITCKIMITLPIQELPGGAVFTINGTDLKGSIIMMGVQNIIDEGKLESDGKITFSGTLKTSVAVFSYVASGTFIDGKLDAKANVKMGDIIFKSI